MKKIHSLYVVGAALVLVSGLLLSNPPSVFASACSASCQYGAGITVSGSSCTCTDNVGCTFTNSRGTFIQSCAQRGETESEIEQGPQN